MGHEILWLARYTGLKPVPHQSMNVSQVNVNSRASGIVLRTGYTLDTFMEMQPGDKFRFY